jgi:hypothetical protein
MFPVRPCVLRGCKWPWRAPGREDQIPGFAIEPGITALAEQLLLANPAALVLCEQVEARSCHTSDRVPENACRP